MTLLSQNETIAGTPCNGCSYRQPRKLVPSSAFAPIVTAKPHISLANHFPRTFSSDQCCKRHRKHEMLVCWSRTKSGMPLCYTPICILMQSLGSRNRLRQEVLQSPELSLDTVRQMELNDKEKYQRHAAPPQLSIPCAQVAQPKIIEVVSVVGRSKYLKKHSD